MLGIRIAAAYLLLMISSVTVCCFQICETIDTVPGFERQEYVDEYHEQIVQHLQTATSLEQVLLAVYTVGNSMIASGKAMMIPQGARIEILETKPLKGSMTSGTGVMNHPVMGSRPEVKLKGRVSELGKTLWFHSNGIDF